MDDSDQLNLGFLPFFCDLNFNGKLGIFVIHDYNGALCQYPRNGHKLYGNTA